MFVSTLIHRDEIPSTSDLARDLVREGGVTLPLLVGADVQTLGRGRGSNVWWSDAGSLTFTLAFDPRSHRLTLSHEPRLALAAAVALIEAIGPNVPSGIRWPNDVEVNGRKLGGLLPERVETPSGPVYLLGVGLNVSTNLAKAPADVRALAATLHEWGEIRTQAEILSAFLGHFETILPRLANDDPTLAQRWAEFDTLRGESVRVDLGSRLLTGIGRGIDHEGALKLETDSETLRLFGGRILRDPGRESLTSS